MMLSPPVATCVQDLFTHLAHQLIIFKFASSYGEHVYALDALSRKARRLGLTLVSEELVRAGDRVAILSENPLKQILFFWACILTGAHPLLLEPDLPDLAAILQSFDPATLFLERPALSKVSPPLPETLAIFHMEDPRFANFDAITPQELTIHVPSHAEAIAFYTLVTHDIETKEMASVLPLRHGELLRRIAQHQEAVHLSNHDILLATSPLSSPLGLILGHLLPLSTGSHQILCASPTDKPMLWLQAIHQHRVTHTQLSFAQGRALLERLEPSDLDALDLSSLTSLLCTSNDARHLHPRHYKEIAHLLSRAALPQHIFHLGLMPSPHHLLDTIQQTSHQLDGFNLHLGALHRQKKIMRARAGEPASVKVASLGLPVWEERPWEIVIAQEADAPLSSHGELFHRDSNGEVTPLGGLVGFFDAESGALHLLGHTSHEVHIDGGSIFLAHLEQIAEQKIASLLQGFVRASQDNQEILLTIHVPARSRPPGDALLEQVRAHLVHTFDFAPSLDERLHLRIRHHRAPREPGVSTPVDIASNEAPSASSNARPARIDDTPRVLLERSELLALRERIEALLRTSDPRPLERFALSLLLDPDANEPFRLEPHHHKELPRHAPAAQQLPQHDETQQLWLSELASTDTPEKSTSPEDEFVAAPGSTSFFEPLPGSITERIEHDYLLRPHTLSSSPLQLTFLQRFLPGGHGWLRRSLELPDVEIDAEQAQRAIASLTAQHPATRAHFLRDHRGGEVTSMRLHISGNRLYYKDLRTHDRQATAILQQHALSHLEGLHHQDLTGRALVYWLVLRNDQGHTVHMHVHRSVLDRQSADALIVAWPETLRGIRQQLLEDAAAALPALDQMAARDALYIAHIEAQHARHEDINIAEFWSTTFDQPYPHYSLRDPRFIQERRELATRYTPPSHLALATQDLIESILLAAYARFVQVLIEEHHDLASSSLSSVVLGVAQRIAWTGEGDAPLANHTLALPLRISLHGTHLQPLDENPARSFIHDVQKSLSQTRANAIAAEHIARVANISTLVAQGVRFVYRHEDQPPHDTNRTSSHEALLDHPLPELNELLLVSQRQPDGALLLRFEIGEDVQLGSRSALQAFDLLLEAIGEHMTSSQ